MADEEFETTDAGASQTEKVESQRLKAGSLVMMKGMPCKVTDVNTAKPGKHGSAKVICKGKDILTGKQYECTFHSGDMVDAPLTSRDEYVLLNIDDNTLELLTKEGEMKSDVNVPEDEHLKDVVSKMKTIFEEGKKECLVTVLSCMGTEQVIDAREGAEVWAKGEATARFSLCQMINEVMRDWFVIKSFIYQWHLSWQVIHEQTI